MAGFAAYIKIDGFNILPVLSISMAATTFAGQNIGAGKADRVRKGMYISTAMGAGYSVITGIVLLIFAPQVIGVFTTNHKVVEYGVYIMKYFCPFYWMLGILHVLGGTIRGTGKTIAGHDCIFGIVMRIPCDVDCRNHGMGKRVSAM